MSERMKVVALGDSLTAGHIGGPFGVRYAPYTDVLREFFRDRASVFNHGLDGDLTSGMVIRFERDVLPLQPDVVLLMGGANDLGWGKENEEIIEHLFAIVDACLGVGIQIFVGAIPPIARIPSATAKRLALNPQIASACVARGVSFVDLFGPLADDSNALQEKYSSDGLHLNAEGYALMGRVFAEALESL